MNNGRFSEYVTSGAFHMALSKHQIASLSQAIGGERYIASAAALERKGLIAPVLDQDGDPLGSDPDCDLTEWRLTTAGSLTLALLHEAGLTNAGADALAAEVDSLRQELHAARRETHDARVRARSILAKLHAAEDALRHERECLAGDKLTINVRPRDPLPDVSADDLVDFSTLHDTERTGR